MVLTLPRWVWIGLLLPASALAGTSCEEEDAPVGTIATTTPSGGAGGGQTHGGSTASGGETGQGATGGGDAGSGGAMPLSELNAWLIGDSTVATGSGWGDFLQPLVDVKATVINRARSGESTLSFYVAADNNLWTGTDGVLTNLAAGDHVLIQFGHNDEHDDVEHHTDPGTAPDYEGTYRQYLELYIDETRAAGGTPILVTPVCRMNFDGDGNHVRDHGEYPAAMLKTGADHDVVVLDLEAYSHEQFQALGEAQTLELFSDGSGTDRTHFPPDKAWRVAEWVALLLADSESALAAYVP